MNLSHRDLTVLHDALARSYNAKVRAARNGKTKKRPSELAMELSAMKGTLDKVNALLGQPEEVGA